MASVLEKDRRTVMTERDDVGQLPDELTKDLVPVLKLLADDTRLRVIHLLWQHRELNVRTLCELLGQSQPAVSHHLALLRMAGLIECRRDGKHNYYHVMPKPFEQWLRKMLEVVPDEASRRTFADYLRDGASVTEGPPDTA